MAAELIIAPEAEQDLADAYAWYESRRSGLGEELLTTVTIYCVFHTSRNPDKWRQRLP